MPLRAAIRPAVAPCGPMTSKAAVLLAALSVLAAGGCAGASTDPHTGGLAGGITGLSTGAYDQRVAERQASLQSLDDAEAGLVRRIGNAEERIRTLDRQIAARKKALQALKAELADIDRRIELLRQSIAISSGMEASARAANERKAQALKPLALQRDLVKRMTDELEASERKEALYYEQLRRDGAGSPQPASPATTDALLAAFEARGREADTRKAEAEQLVRTLKIQVAQLGG